MKKLLISSIIFFSLSGMSFAGEICFERQSLPFMTSKYCFDADGSYDSYIGESISNSGSYTFYQGVVYMEAVSTTYGDMFFLINGRLYQLITNPFIQE